MRFDMFCRGSQQASRCSSWVEPVQQQCVTETRRSETSAVRHGQLSSVWAERPHGRLPVRTQLLQRLLWHQGPVGVPRLWNNHPETHQSLLEQAGDVIGLHPSSTICIFLIRNQSPTALLDMHHLTCGISSLLLSTSTSSCSLSSWFTSSCTYHLITVITFALTIYHSLDLSLQT